MVMVTVVMQANNVAVMVFVVQRVLAVQDQMTVEYVNQNVNVLVVVNVEMDLVVRVVEYVAAMFVVSQLNVVQTELNV